MAERWILELERGLRTVFGGAGSTDRPYPGEGMEEREMSFEDKRHVGGLMRVNHTGEVCAQALYFGQALSHRNPKIAAALRQMGEEEGDHLAWYRKRLEELSDHSSYLDGFFYMASFLMGMMVGLASSDYGLAFVEETEQQVGAHLAGHLADPVLQQDAISQRLVEVMKEDEAAHASCAHALGAKALPEAIKRLMKGLAKCMTGSTYYL